MTPRHLITHLWPGREHQTWRRTVQHLRARWPLFTGRREVSIAVDATTVDPAEVIDAFGDCDASFRIVGNDPQRGEGVSFPSLLRAVANEPGHTFYCHSKGATYPAGSISERWADVMFHLCLDYPEVVGATLQDHPIAGPCKRVEQRMGVDWHYSGAFFWFRNAEIECGPMFQASPVMRNSRFGAHLDLTSDRNAVERWPAMIFTDKDAGDLGLSNPRNLYDEINWRSWIEPRLRREFLFNDQRLAELRNCTTDFSMVPETTSETLRRLYAV